MAHARKKGGVRKDKKNEKMREDVAVRKANAHEHHSTDQQDNVEYKSGSASDDNRQHNPPC